MIRIVDTEIAAPTTAGTADNVSFGASIRVFNSAAAGTNHLVTLVNELDSGEVGSFTLGGGSTEIVRKLPAERIYAANAAIRLTKVGS